MVTSLDIQPALEERIAALNEYSRDRSSRLGEGRVGVRAKHWIQYEGSQYDDPIEVGSGSSFSQDRELKFAHYVEVTDLQRDYANALQIHELLMSWLNGYFPKVDTDQIKSPLTLESDDLVSVPGSDDEPKYRYRARYIIRVGTVVQPSDDPFEFDRLNVGLWRSPASQVGNKPVSTKDAELIFEENP